MNTLERITLDGCHAVTNVGVAKLARLPVLKELRVSSKGVTKELLAMFPASLAVDFER